MPPACLQSPQKFDKICLSLQKYTSLTGLLHSGGNRSKGRLSEMQRHRHMWGKCHSMMEAEVDVLKLQLAKE